MGTRHSIASRYVVLTVSLVGLSSLVLSFLLWKKGDEAVRNQWLQYGETVAQSIARQSQQDLQTGDYSTLRTIVKQAAAGEDVQWLAIRDGEARLIASLSKSSRSVPDRPLLEPASTAWRHPPEPDNRAGADMEWQVPVLQTQAPGPARASEFGGRTNHPAPLGYIQLGMKQRGKGAMALAFLKSVLLAVVGILAFAAVVANGAIGGSARRLQDLLQVARASAPLDSDSGLSSAHRDEITQLAEAFVVLSARSIPPLAAVPEKRLIASSEDDVVFQRHEEDLGFARSLRTEDTFRGGSPIGVALPLGKEDAQQEGSPIGVAHPLGKEDAQQEGSPIGVALPLRTGAARQEECSVGVASAQDEGISSEKGPIGVASAQDEGISSEKGPIGVASVRTTCVLPARKGEESISRAPTPIRAPDFPGRYYGRVLLVEDERTNMDHEKETLESLGCRVDLAWNGRQAVEVFMRSNYDIVLMDSEMPEMDGYQAALVIRKMEAAEGQQDSRTPIVAMVTQSTREERRKCQRAGMNDTVTKPFVRDTVAIVLDRWLNEGQRVSVRRKTSEEVALFPLAAPLADASSSQPSSGESGARSAPKSEIPEPVIHPKALHSIRALQRPGGPDIVAKTIEFYLEDSLELMKVLNEAVAKANPDSIRGTAHRLKSSSANLGALHMAALCKELEELGRAKTVAGSKEVLSRIEREYDKVRSALSENS